MNRTEIKRTLERYYYKTPRPEAKLALLDELDALPAAIKKQLKYDGVLLDIPSQRLLQHWAIAVEAFKEADTEYWKHHDPGARPDPGTTDMWSWPTNEAMARASRKPAPRPSKKRPPVPDYARAREALLRLVEPGHDQDGMRRDATKMLAAIALRHGEPREAIRCLEPLDDFHAAPGMAQAYAMLGDDTQLAAWLTRATGLTHRGYLAELQGDDEAAIRFYLEAMNTPQLRIWHSYGALRLRRMQARLGKAVVDRVKRSLAKPQALAKIEIGSIADFHARFGEIAAAIRKEQGDTAPPQPLTDAAIAKMRLPNSRRARMTLVPVPPSVRTILRTDKNFRLWKHAEPLLGRLRPVDIEKVVRRDLAQGDGGLRPLAKLPATVPVWNDDAGLPACIALASPGDQKLLLYMGDPDEGGEFPVARYDDQPELWISDASLVHYILGAAEKVVTTKIDLARALKQACRRNARHREGFSKHPRVQAILAKH